MPTDHEVGRIGANKANTDAWEETQKTNFKVTKCICNISVEHHLCTRSCTFSQPVEKPVRMSRWAGAPAPTSTAAIRKKGNWRDQSSIYCLVTTTWPLRSSPTNHVASGLFVWAEEIIWSDNRGLLRLFLRHFPPPPPVKSIIVNLHHDTFIYKSENFGQLFI